MAGAESFRFSIQPPEEIHCNPLDTAFSLVCAVTRIKGIGNFTVQWVHNDTSGTIETLDSIPAVEANYCDYIKVAVYEGLHMISDIAEIAGQYWCNVTHNDTEEQTSFMSNIFMIDHEIDYTQFNKCENVLIEEVISEGIGTSSVNDNQQLIERFVPAIAFETALIIGLIVSNIVLLVLWKKSWTSNNKKGANSIMHSTKPLT